MNRINKGGYFGELALVTHKPRAASAYAVGDVKLACEYNIIYISKFIFLTLNNYNYFYLVINSFLLNLSLLYNNL